MSKDLFIQMREQEILTKNFVPTKKEIQKASKNFALKMINEGDFNIIEQLSQAIRLKEAITVIESELRASLPQENFEAFGLSATYRNGGFVANYEDCPVYADLKKQMDERKELLNIALKIGTEVYDSDGILVPKVSRTERKGSLSIIF